MLSERSLFFRPLAALALAAFALMAAPAAYAADPPKAVAAAPDQASKAVLKQDADTGHTSALGAVLGLLIVIGIVALIVKKGRESSGPSSGNDGPGGGSGTPTRPPHT